MDLIDLLRNNEGDIIDEATRAIARSGIRAYTESDRQQMNEQLKTLFDSVMESLAIKSATPMMNCAEIVAEQRFSSGFSLRQVQTAINVLEECIWEHIQNKMEPKEYAIAFGRVSTALRIGKEAIAAVYLAHVTKREVPSLDRMDEFAGTPVFQTVVK